MIDKATRDQVRLVLEASKKALEQLVVLTGNRELAFRVAPSSTFINFAALSQLAKQSPADQVAYINAALVAVGQVLGTEASYGKDRECAPVTSEMAEKAVEVARLEIGKALLVINIKAEREKILYKSLLEFAAISKLLSPKNQGQMMSQANELVARVIAAEGPLGKNVVKIH